MQDTGKMSGWGQQIISIIGQRIICTKERENKCCGYSEEEERTRVREHGKGVALKGTWKLGSFLWRWEEKGTPNTIDRIRTAWR